MNSIPNWLKSDENYKAEKTNSAFLDKTLLEIGSKLNYFYSYTNNSLKPNSLIYLLFIFSTILTMSISKNMFYTYIILALLIIRLCLIDSNSLTYVMKTSFKAFIFSFIILLPSFFISKTNSFITISIKVFISVSLVCLFNRNYKTNEIISSFKMMHIPDVFIETLDMTFKYIVILSNSCKEILLALKCRLIGKSKNNAMTNIVSKTYLHAKKESDEMLDAMKCRGFIGEYYNHSKFSIRVYDILFILTIILEVIGLIYLK